MIESFRPGETLFICTTPPNALVYGNQWRFELGSEPFPVPEKNHAKGSGIGMFVTKACLSPEVAFNFISFILSEKVQSSIAAAKWAVPCRRSAVKSLAAFLRCPEEVLDAIVNRSVVELRGDTIGKRYGNHMIYNARSELRDILSGQCASKECADRFMRHWNGEYPTQNFTRFNKSATRVFK